MRDQCPRLSFIFKATTLALYWNNLGVMEQSVERGGGQHTVSGEGLIPCAKTERGGHEGGVFFVRAATIWKNKEACSLCKGK